MKSPLQSLIKSALRGVIATVLIFGIGAIQLPLRAAGEGTPSTTVKKTAEDFSGPLWKLSQWNKAQGTISSDTSHAPDLSDGKSEKIEVHFSGNGFENFTAEPPTDLYIPGDVHSITLRVKRSDNRFPVQLDFADGWGRVQAGDKHFSVEAKLDPKVDDWQTVTVDIPQDWVRPLRLAGITTHNYTTKNQKSDVTFMVDDIEAETDISGVDPITGVLKTWAVEASPADPAKALKEAPVTPLVSVAITTPEVCNIFSNTEPSVSVQVRNWKDGTLTGKASFTVTDDQGNKGKPWEQALSVESAAAFSFPVEAKRYGLYTLTAHVELSDGTKVDKTMKLSRVPDQKELTEAQKWASPYGMNYHSGGVRIYEPFKKTGIYWYREYCFTLEWMLRAKGADRKYAGWPYYPSIIQDYEQLGLIVMPVINAIRPAEFKDGKVVSQGPNQEWVRDVSDIINAFPSVRVWELDNEYDLPFRGFSGKEEMVKWENFKLYHKKFGELINLLGGGKLLAVEQGNAGIFPKRDLDYVKSGAFDQIDVINSHHYCGTEPPEINAQNYNQGLQPGQTPGFFFDSLRAEKRAANADGKKRQSWLTEFGWDNVSGPAVTDEQQAAYLQRGFLVAFAAGTDRAFWFYNFDGKKQVQIFDSCGFFTYDHQPKLVANAMAGLTSILPRPVYVGSINTGPNTAGYVFETDGTLVAGLWAIEGNTGPTVNVKAKQLYDYFGNKLPGASISLKMAPTYAVGLDKSDPLYKQTAYSFESPYLVVVTAGDTVDTIIGVNNNRAEDISGEVKVALPAGWTSPKAETPIAVKAGQKQQLTIPLTVGPEEKLGIKEVAFTFYENKQAVKTIPLRVVVRRPFTIEPLTLQGAPGLTTASVKITNQSNSPRSGVLKLSLPLGWTAGTPEVTVTDLKPGESREVPVQLTWTPDWKDEESASVVFTPAQGASLSAPIIPDLYRIHKGAATIDGKLDDWKPNQQFPGWMLGSTFPNPDAKIWLSWAPEGLYVAAEVNDSKIHNENPKSFWDCDALELFISTQPDKRGTSYHEGDHHFWFVPLVKENRVYVGRWKGKDESGATAFDIPGVKSVARKTDTGYVMEFLLPASAFDSYGLKAGSTIALNFNIKAYGASFNREVYWPWKKDTGIHLHPDQWGLIKIVE